MITVKNVLIFLAGAEFHHTLMHVLLPYFVQMPLQMKDILLTSSMNNWAIGINGLITLALLWGASRFK